MSQYNRQSMVRFQRKIIIASLALFTVTLAMSAYTINDLTKELEATKVALAEARLEKPVTPPETPQIEPQEPEPTEEPTDTPQEPEPEPEPEIEQTAAFFELTDEQRDLVERTVAAEARGEPLEGQVAVAQTIYQRCIDGNLTIEEVLVPGQYASPYKGEVPDTTKEAVSLVFDLGVMAVSEPIMAFYAPAYGTSGWHENKLEFVTEIGSHRFFKEG